MAGLVIAGHAHQRHTSSVATMGHGDLMSSAPTIEMVPNPAFSFPMMPPNPHTQDATFLPQDARRRPAPMRLDPSPERPAHAHHIQPSRTLPSFSFNAADASGLQSDDSTPPTPDENAAAASTRRGHRRGGSEFVGGDSRFGVSSAISTSPTKETHPSTHPPTLPASLPARRGHAHRRSAAMSSHDVTSIMSPSEVSPRLSNSLPSTPLDHPAHGPPHAFTRSFSTPALDSDFDMLPAPADGSSTRPPSRPRVEFVDQVEIIPRPLSTISSETEGSLSTVRGHSVNNSISSVLSLSASSPPSSRSPRRTMVDTSVPSFFEPRTRARSSIETSKRVEREGEWLKSKFAAVDEEKRSYSEGAAANLSSPTLSTSEPAAPQPRPDQQKRQSVRYALGFDRRRSEPFISSRAADFSRLSALSLQEHALRDDDAAAAALSEQTGAIHHASRRSSTQKLKDWALSKLHKRPREIGRSPSMLADPLASRPESAGSVEVPGRVPVSEPVVAETNLDAVFGREGRQDSSTPPRLATPTSRIEFNMPATQHTDLDDASHMVDLDAALGPMRTPPMGSGMQRRALHSSRLTKDFSGPGGHYHRRAESAPALAPFEYNRVGTPSQSSMADVFEEEEEEEADTKMGRSLRKQIQADQLFSVMGGAEGLRVQRGESESEKRSMSHGSSLSVPCLDRPAFLAEEVIVEETGQMGSSSSSSPSSPVGDEIEIVEAHEEPRASSLTKSSDSSDASTLLAAPTAAPEPGEATALVTTPDAYHSPALSSPDFSRRQGSFETPRLGTSASSIADNRTMSSCATGGEPSGHEVRMSVDDVPSLTSSRSTMMSSMHQANGSRRELAEQRVYPGGGAVDSCLGAEAVAERRKKRASMHSLSQLVGGSFGPRARAAAAAEDFEAATAANGRVVAAAPKKETRLKRLLFWRPKHPGQQGDAPNRLHKEQRV